MARFNKKQEIREGMRQPIGIYIHVPFCKRKCAYCDFYSRPCKTEKEMDEYVSAVLRHFEEYFRPGSNFEADTVYFGGGTPSLLGDKRLLKLIEGLDKRILLRDSAEITVECNPESTDLKMLKKLKKGGVNRLSFGVQSADNDELVMLGRLHTFEMAQEAVSKAQEAGFTNISLDLMYGLPGQTMEKWQESVKRILALKPQHLSAYALKLEEGTPMWREKPALPSDDLQADMYLYAVERFAREGYYQYEVSNFAKEGYRSRHNSKYWDLSPYLGFGPSAHSYFGGKRFSFVDDLQAYVHGMDGKAEILESADEVENYRRPGEYIMLMLRTTDGIDEEKFYQRFRMEFTPFAAKLRKYIEPGYCKEENGRWWLTPQGMFVSNAILADVLDCTEFLG